MKQLAPLVHALSQYRPERRLDANGHFVQAAPGEPGVLVDPVAFQPGDEAHLRELGGVAAVLLTGGDRAARAEAAVACRAAFGCPVLVPPETPRDFLEDAGLSQAAPFAYEAGLPGGCEAIPLPDGTFPGEVAFYHGPSGSLLLGEAVVGAPAGGLSPAPAGDAGALPDAAGAARALRSLLARPLRRVLVAWGQPVLREPERALQDLVYRHDPAACLLKPDELGWQPLRAMGGRFARRSGECSRLLGLRVLDFEVTVVPPGKQNTLLHLHDGLEEAFIVLQGEGELLTGRGAFPVRAGDILGFPPRYQVPHAFRNTGAEDLRLLSFGALAQPDEAVGLAEYPESGKQLQDVPGKVRRFYLPEQLNVDYWEGERLD